MRYLNDLESFVPPPINSSVIPATVEKSYGLFDGFRLVRIVLGFS